MATINSVLGPLDTADLGFTLSHEHVLVTSAGILQTYPEFVDRAGLMEESIDIFGRAYAEGVRTIIDLTTMDLGRDVKFLEQVSRESGVQIICATGVWLDIPRAFWDATPDMVAPLFIREIEVGIDQTGIKAGIIKVATDGEGVTREGEVILLAAARAHKVTGAPISTHTWAPARVGEDQLRIFREEGVDADRVYVGHSDNTDDLDYLKRLLDHGAWVGLDMLMEFGSDPGTPDLERRIQTAKALIDAGYGHRLMMGQDWLVTTDLFGGKNVAEEIKRRNPDGYLTISRQVLPRLIELGVSQEVTNQIMVDNPRRFFEGE